MLLGMIILLGGVIMVIRHFLSTPSMDCTGISAEVTPQNVYFENGDSISFSDATPGSNEWLWEFGDGGKSDKPKGKYLFSSPGHYTVKLTVNGSCTDTFPVWVNRMMTSDDSITVIIEGPKTIHAGQRVQYKCIAPKATSFSWKFGESGLQDSKEQNPYYSFNTPNSYKITVATDAAKTPGSLEVTVLPKEIPKEGLLNNTPAHKAPGKEVIKFKLQSIADNGTYSTQDLNWIRDNFLNGTLTKVSCNLQGVSTLETLFGWFGANSNTYQVIDAVPTLDDSQMITFVSVKVKERKEQ